MRPRTTWEKLAAPRTGPDPDEEPRVFLDAVLPGPSPAGFRGEWPASTNLVDPLATSGWSFAAQAFLDSGQARPGARVACADPHSMELGAFGIAAFHHAPSALHARALSGFEPLGLVRRTLVHVNDRVPVACDPMDVAFLVIAEARPAVSGLTALEFSGDAVVAMDVPGRRRLLAAAGLTGCLTATGPLDATTREAWRGVAGQRRTPTVDLEGLRSEEGAVHEELVVLNGADVRPAVLLPERHELVPPERLSQRSLTMAVLGGCIGGDLGSLRSAVALLERSRPAKTVATFLVPASEELFKAGIAEGLAARAEVVGAHFVAPHDVPVGGGFTLATTPCLAPAAGIAAPSTIVASAHGGRARSPESA